MADEQVDIAPTEEQAETPAVEDNGLVVSVTVPPPSIAAYMGFGRDAKGERTISFAPCMFAGHGFLPLQTTCGGITRRYLLEIGDGGDIKVLSDSRNAPPAEE